ncbi:MAG: nucleoside hydrolase [Actinomycetota bacterium]|nr:nucleoside hydrolase [Actinomycetota bacterium]
MNEPTDTTAAAPAPVPLLLDVDTGIDDSLALLYAAASVDADLVAVTTCGGNVELADTTRNTLAVLELAGRTDVEVAMGRPRPIARPLETTPETHGPRGIGHSDLTTDREPSKRDGPTLIVDEARARPGELTLVALGPLTNLAVAVLVEPRLPFLLKRVLVMGGCFARNGNAGARAEWNVHVDPEATKVVLAAWEAAVAEGAPPLELYGLDVTEGVQLYPRHLVALADAAGAPLGGEIADASPEQIMVAGSERPIVRFALDALRFYFEFHAEFDGFYGAFVHDPFVVAAALDPGLATTRTTTVDIELGGRLTTEETVADWRNHWGRPANAAVAVAIDAEAFLERLVARVGALAAAPSVAT